MLLVVASFVLILFLLGAIAGVTYEIVRRLEPVAVQKGIVYSQDNFSFPVQTANSDMTISKDGMLVSRPIKGRRRRSGPAQTDLPGLGRRSAMTRDGCMDDGTCPLTTMSKAISTTHPLSSLLADAYFEELKMLKISQVCVCVCARSVCVCVRERERERECVCVCVCVYHSSIPM